MIFNMIFRCKNKKSTLIKLCLLVSIWVMGNLVFSRNDKTIQDQKEIPDEIRQLLQMTPNLWRKFDLGENDTSRRRIQVQQQWIEQFSRTQYLKDNPHLKKVMWMEDPAWRFYWTGGVVNCPFAPQFEKRCILQEIPFPRNYLGLFRYIGLDGQVNAVLGVRDGDYKPRVPVPEGIIKILSIVEAPAHIRSGGDMGADNAWLASYWRGSDIPIPYQIFIPYDSDAQNVHGSNVTNLSPALKKLLPKIRTKTKLVAAMISSRCGLPWAPSDRLKYIYELEKTVRVDVFGDCGTLTCPKFEMEACHEKIETEYKFFLAFENSRCEDYITEKMFTNALEYHTVPVVMGARPSDYLAAAPPNSYIHVDDFESPDKLGEYLKYLDGNEEAYLKYFEWVGTGYISNAHFQDYFCRACGMLFYADFVPAPSWNRSWFGSVGWRDVNRCLASGEPRW